MGRSPGKRRFVFGFAIDDVHWHFNPYRPVDACLAWVMVKAKELTAEALMESMSNGMFYSSNGPKIIDVDVKDESIYVKTSTARSITFVANDGLGQRFTAPADPLTEATYRVGEEESYVRIGIKGTEGGTAWTNPIILKRT